MEQLPPVEIPLEQLSPEILCSIIESFVLREGTDYGAQEISLERKIKQIQKQLDRSEIKVVFDPNTESVTLLTRQDWHKLQSSLKDLTS